MDIVEVEQRKSERARRRAARINAWPLMAPEPLEAKTLANVLLLSRVAIGRFLAGKSGPTEAKRVRAAFEAWLLRCLQGDAFDPNVARLFTEEVMRSLDDASFVDLLYWTRLVRRPRRRGAR